MAGTQYRGSEIKDVDQFVKDAAVGHCSCRDAEVAIRKRSHSARGIRRLAMAMESG